MGLELIEACIGFASGMYVASVAARHRVSSLLSPRSFFGRALGRGDK
jgi:hypothetical protein